MYLEMTQGVRIEVEPTYIPDKSKPEMNYFVFAYRIKIVNERDTPTQLVSRRWIITDGNGEVHEVKGPGVIGQQPILAPQEEFEYSSFCPLPTPTGNMRGTYQMVDQNQMEYDVKIPLFFLRDMRSLH
jgi:ApaG protein